MKRVVVLLIFAVLGVAAVSYGLSRHASFRHSPGDARFAPTEPLVLDAATKAVFAGADRVETFRLADFHEGEMDDHNPAEQAALDGHLGWLDNHTILRVGAPQGKEFAANLNAALSQLNDNPSMPSCFDPGVGFRVWKGKAHTDLCVCFYCSGVEIITKDAKHKEVYHHQTVLGGSRAAFLALARQAFPQDAHIAALKG